jgi:hypothetical protein
MYHLSKNKYKSLGELEHTVHCRPMLQGGAIYTSVGWNFFRGTPNILSVDIKYANLNIFEVASLKLRLTSTEQTY